MVLFQEVSSHSLQFRASCGLCDEVKVVELISEGGQSQVYKGHIKSSGKNVVLKVFYNSAVAQRESRALGALHHNRIPKFHGSFTYGDFAGLVIDHISGRNLGEMLKLEPFVTVYRALAQQVLEILAYMHSKNILHNDISPGNIIWNTDKDFYLIDFGAASFGPLRSALPFGHPSYLAPEIMFGYPTNARSDLYSLGALLFKVITHKNYCWDKLESSFYLLQSKLNQDKEFFALLKALLAPNPRLRPPSAESILKAFSWVELRDPMLIPTEDKAISRANMKIPLGTCLQFFSST